VEVLPKENWRTPERRAPGITAHLPREGGADEFSFEGCNIAACFGFHPRARFSVLQGASTASL